MQFKDVKQMRKATLPSVADARDVSAGTGVASVWITFGSSGDLEHYNFLLEQAEALKQQPGHLRAVVDGK